MKKIIALLSVCMVISSVSCAAKQTESSQNSEQSAAVTDVQEATEQPDPLAPENTRTTTSAVSTATTTAVTTSVSASDTRSAVTTQAVTEQPDPQGAGIFSYDDSGAIVFDKPEEKQDDAVLMSAAQKLFESACQTYWKFLVNCPYSLDYSSYVENDFKWQFYKITDPDIHSLADVERDYCKVFSERYPNSLSDNYRESNGAVYALNGERGAHLYYSASKITDIQSKTDDEIFFTVENYYDGSDFGDDSYSETDTFSMVLENGTWKAGQFTLPY